MTILINLNDARKKLNELEGSAEYNKGVTDAFNALFDLPTIEAEPVKHGRWINDKGLYKCSICNNFTITGWANCIPIEQMNKTMKYCNNCGAKMDEVEE